MVLWLQESLGGQRREPLSPVGAGKRQCRATIGKSQGWPLGRCFPSTFQCCLSMLARRRVRVFQEKGIMDWMMIATRCYSTRLLVNIDLSL